MSFHIWAPELHQVFGKWYIYFAGGEKDHIWKIRPNVLECQSDDPIAGPWVEKGKMKAAKDDKFSFRAFSLDPLSWKKERWPVLKTDWEKGVYGPGHNSFTKDEAGNDILVFHARTESEIVGNPLYNPNRHAMLQKIRWTEQKPIFSFDNK